MEESYHNQNQSTDLDHVGYPKIEEEDDDSVYTKSIDGYRRGLKKRKGLWHFLNASCWILAGSLLVIGIELSGFKIGLISFPDNGTTLESPECYACVGIETLDGTYSSVIDIVESGVEFKVKTSQTYYESGLVDTVVDIVKDPLNIFVGCTCPNVPYVINGVNCSISYIDDSCDIDCEAENGITLQATEYDPVKDQVLQQILITVFGIKVEQVAIYNKE